MYGEDVGFDLYLNRRYEDAVRQLRETMGLAPEDPLARIFLALALEAAGKPSDALEQANHAMKLPGLSAVSGSLGGLFCRLQCPDRAQEILRQLEAAEKAGTYISPLQFAMVHLALGDKTKGLARLKETMKEHSVNFIFTVSDPVFDQVREDPEFAALMHEIRLSPACWREVPRYRK